MDAKQLLHDQMFNHIKVFLKGLEDTPEAHFHAVPPAGGHSVAWHALHILDWNRILVSPGLAGVVEGQTFAYLGWEDRDWARAVHGPSPALESDSKNRIIETLKTDFERGLRDIAAVADTQLQTKIKTPMGERVAWDLLTTQLRHIAYHWGQARLTALQLAKASS
jgi:hypothetical protein